MPNQVHFQTKAHSVRLIPLIIVETLDFDDPAWTPIVLNKENHIRPFKIAAAQGLTP